MTRSRNALIVAAIYAATVIGASHAIAAEPKRTPDARKIPDVPLLDSHFTPAWWRAASPDERSGFELGANECVFRRLHQETDLYDQDKTFQKLDKVLKDGTAKDVSLGRALEGILPTGKKVKRKLRKDDDDGDAVPYTIWVNVSAEKKQGIVEGYVTCEERHSQKIWSNKPEYYVMVIDLMFNVDQKYGEDQYDGMATDVLDLFGYKP
jgi:hypothetical protein